MSMKHERLIGIAGAICAAAVSALLVNAANWPSTSGTTTPGVVIEDGAGNKIGVIGAPLVTSLASHVTTQSSPANPTGTSNTAACLMMGLNITITPGSSGIVLMIASGTVTNSVSGSGYAISLRRGTGTAPTNGAAAAGTVVGTQISGTLPTGNNGHAFSLNGIVSGLVVATAVWTDLCVQSITSGTVSPANLSFSLAEIN